MSCRTNREMLIQTNYANAIKEIKSRVSAAFNELKEFWKGFDDKRLIPGDPSLATKPIFFAQTKLQALLEYLKRCEDSMEAEDA